MSRSSRTVDAHLDAHLDAPLAMPAGGGEHEDLMPLPEPMRITRAGLVYAALVVVVALGLVFLLGYLPHRHKLAAAATAAAQHDEAAPRVEVTHPRPASSALPVSLPGSIEPLRDTLLYARASGYVRRWTADIGDRVTQGQLLAELDTPELDQELAGARSTVLSRRAALEQARADLAFARTQTRRFEALGPSGVAAQQEVEDKRTRETVAEAGVHAAEAALAGQEAAVRRLEELHSFARVVAPFAGVITERHVEQGTLVAAGTGGGQGLYRVAATDPVRVYVQVPQDWSVVVKAGAAATMKVREYPGRSFVGKVTRTAGALDPASRTLRTEVQVGNQDGALLTGMYAQLSIDLPSPHATLRVPSTALMLDSHGMRVAVVGPGDRLKFVSVQLERDSGSEASIVGGLDAAARVVVTPGEATVEGAQITPVERAAK